MRDDRSLIDLLDSIIAINFPEVADHRELLSINFGRRARTRLGSIKQTRGRGKQSIITINGLFREEKYPTDIIRATIAHELCHFVHGFSSPLPQLASFPHLGGIVDKELVSRGLGDLLKFQKRWLKAEWQGIVKANFKPTTRRRRRRARYSLRWF